MLGLKKKKKEAKKNKKKSCPVQYTLFGTRLKSGTGRTDWTERNLWKSMKFMRSIVGSGNCFRPAPSTATDGLARSGNGRHEVKQHGKR